MKLFHEVDRTLDIIVRFSLFAASDKKRPRPLRRILFAAVKGRFISVRAMYDFKGSQLHIARIAGFERLSKNHYFSYFSGLMDAVHGNELSRIFSEHNPLLRLARLTGNSRCLRYAFTGARHNMLKRQTARRCRNLQLRNRDMPRLIGDNLAFFPAIFPSDAFTGID